MLGASVRALTVVSPTHSHMWYSGYSIGSLQPYYPNRGTLCMNQCLSGLPLVQVPVSSNQTRTTSNIWN